MSDDLAFGLAFVIALLAVLRVLASPAPEEWL